MSITGDIVTKDEFAHDKALAAAIMTIFGELLEKRTNDLPHRFRAPRSFAEYMTDWGTNTIYHSVPIHGSNSANYMTMELTTRPTQKIFEIIFQGADGMRLFTLEIEYGGTDDTKKR